MRLAAHRNPDNPNRTPGVHRTPTHTRTRTRLRHLGPLRLDPLHAILSVLTLVLILLLDVELALAHWRLGVGFGVGVFLCGSLVVFLVVFGVFALLSLPESAGGSGSIGRSEVDWETVIRVERKLYHLDVRKVRAKEVTSGRGCEWYNGRDREYSEDLILRLDSRPPDIERHDHIWSRRIRIWERRIRSEPTL
jgi:hypothetical protein